jgi:putative acetyltransferase
LRSDFFDSLGYFRSLLGDGQDAFDPCNALASLSEVALLYDGPRAVACGALRYRPARVAELKRLYVSPEYPSAGLGRRLVAALEARAARAGYTELVLETNPRFADAVAFYRRLGFGRIQNFGPYRHMDTLCLGKKTVPGGGEGGRPASYAAR